MSNDYSRGGDHIRPAHAGFLMRHVLMANFRLSETAMAEIMETSPARVASILDGSEKLSSDDAGHLKDRFGSAAVSLMRVQEMGSFFDAHGRRPDQREKEIIFSRLAL